MFDIARLVSNCVDAEVRRQIEKDLIGFYYDQLTEELGKHGKTPRFSRKQVSNLNNKTRLTPSIIGSKKNSAIEEVF